MIKQGIFSNGKLTISNVHNIMNKITQKWIYKWPLKINKAILSYERYGRCTIQLLCAYIIYMLFSVTHTKGPWVHYCKPPPLPPTPAQMSEIKTNFVCKNHWHWFKKRKSEIAQSYLRPSRSDCSSLRFFVPLLLF